MLKGKNSHVFKEELFFLAKKRGWSRFSGKEVRMEQIFRERDEDGVEIA
ncbi:hypothetical protein [Pedobacter steynii]